MTEPFGNGRSASSPKPERGRLVRIIAIGLAGLGGVVVLGFIAAAATIYVATRGYGGLHDAVRQGDAFAVRCFLLKCADVNAVDKEGVTPLHWAAAMSDKDITEVLIAAGADLAAKDSNGRTPLHCAWPGPIPVGGRVSILDLVTVRVSLVGSEKKVKKIAELLIASGADVNARDGLGRTPLHIAVHWRPWNIRCLIDNGADLNVKDNNGRTPLQMAVESGDNDLADLLRKHGARE